MEYEIFKLFIRVNKLILSVKFHSDFYITSGLALFTAPRVLSTDKMLRRPKS